jgi:hypothetical protein
MSRRRRRCDGCNCSLGKIPLAPMLTDSVWRRLSNPGERQLCGNCFFRRADERGIKLSSPNYGPVRSIYFIGGIPGSICSAGYPDPQMEGAVSRRQLMKQRGDLLGFMSIPPAFAKLSPRQNPSN